MLGFHNAFNQIDRRAVDAARTRGDAYLIRSGALKPDQRLSSAEADGIYAAASDTLLEGHPDLLAERVVEMCGAAGPQSQTVKTLGDRERVRACLDMLPLLPRDEQFTALRAIIQATRRLPAGSQGPIYGNAARMTEYFEPEERLQAAQSINAEVPHLAVVDRPPVFAGLHHARAVVPSEVETVVTDGSAIRRARATEAKEKPQV